jgi:hypothetical protein
MSYFVESLLNVKKDAGTYFLSFHDFSYFIDDSVALCGLWSDWLGSQIGAWG